MYSNDRNVVLSSYKVDHHSIRVHEDDCGIYEHGILGFQRETDRFFDVQDDCACADDGLALIMAREPIQTDFHYVRPELHTAPLGNGFFLAFNPMGDAGVVVLNAPAYDLLEQFNTPQTLAHSVRQLGDVVEGLQTAQTLVELGLLEPVGSQRRPQPQSPQTLTAWLTVSASCNLACDFCYVRKTPDRMALKQGRAAVDAIFRSAVANGFRSVKLKYAGGEATLNFPTVLALHDYAIAVAARHGLELMAVLLTNGVIMTSRMIRALKERAIKVMVSLDGIGSDHDLQRVFHNGRGSFAHVERTLDRLAEHDLTPTISITLTQRNLYGIGAVVAYVLKRGLPFTLNFYRENECSASFVDLAFQEEALIEAMLSAFAVIEADLPPQSLLGALVDRARLDVPHDRPCGVGSTYMVVNQHGGVAHCHMELERTITDVSAADPLLLLRTSTTGIHNLSVTEKEGCRNCSWRFWCAGGCPALTHRMTGRWDIKSPNCHIYKALFPSALRLEALRLLKYGGYGAVDTM